MNCSKIYRVLLGTLLFFIPGLMSFQAQALNIKSYSAALYDRFSSGYASSPVANTGGSFAGAGLDFSGVGWNPLVTSQSFVMIDDTHFLMATHYTSQLSSSSIDFFSLTNGVVQYAIDPNGYTTIMVNGQQTDLSVGTLATPLNSSDHIATYAILNLPSSSAYLGLSLYVYGHSDNGDNSRTSPVVGTNTLGQVDVLNQVANTVAFGFAQGAGSGQAYGQSGDSGSPTFTVVNGELALLGIHSSISANPNTTYDVFVPDYLSELSQNGIAYSTVVSGPAVATVVPQPVAASAVPEPSVSTLAGIGAAGLFGLTALARRRSSKFFSVTGKRFLCSRLTKLGRLV
jgi:hypothetical protein